MTHSDIRIQALIVDAMACNARIESMKASNAHAALNRYSSVPYGYGEFHKEAAQLEYIASAIRLEQQS